MDRDAIKNWIDLEHDRFKFFFTIVMALTGGVIDGSRGSVDFGFNSYNWRFIPFERRKQASALQQKRMIFHYL